MVRTTLTIIAAICLLGTACTDTTDEDTSEATTTSAAAAAETSTSTTSATAEQATTSTDAISDMGGAVGALSEWKGQLAFLTVPLDHDVPAGPTIEVPVWRQEASDPERRIGVLLVNPGGPGSPAHLLLTDGSAFSPELKAHFDIVALDPRGTFPVTEVDCLDDYGAYVSSVDWSPDTPDEVEAMDAAIQAAVDECVERNIDVLPHISTMDTVHDMALLVTALGEEQVSYLGRSYGSALGAAFATAYPALVRAAVLDAAYHPMLDMADAMLIDAVAIEGLLVRITEECDADPDCPIEGGAQAAFERVAAAADARPFASDPDLDAVNQMAFFFSIAWSDVANGGSADQLLKMVAAADGGNTAQLQRWYAEMTTSLSADSTFSLGANLAISCLDYAYRGPADVPDGFAAELEAVAPTYHAIFPNPEGFDPFSLLDECERWPVGPDLFPAPLSGEGAGPVLVVSATGDAVTPTSSAELLAAELIDSTLLLVEDNRHISYEAFPTNAARRCVTEAIDRFLTDLVPPPAGTVCGA